MRPFSTTDRGTCCDELRVWPSLVQPLHVHAIVGRGFAKVLVAQLDASKRAEGGRGLVLEPDVRDTCVHGSKIVRCERRVMELGTDDPAEPLGKSRVLDLRVAIL